MSTTSRRALLTAAAGGVGAAFVTGAAAARPSVQARQVPLLSTYIAGSGRYEGPRVAHALEPGGPLHLMREPDNDYDTLSVSVWTATGGKLGYLPRIHNQALANLMDAGLEPVARILSVRPAIAHPDIRVAVTLSLTQ